MWCVFLLLLCLFHVTFLLLSFSLSFSSVFSFLIYFSSYFSYYYFLLHLQLSYTNCGKLFHYLTLLYFTLVNSSAIGVEWIDNRTSLIDPVVHVCHRDSHLLVPSRYIILPAISWPSTQSSTFWLDHEGFALGRRWCHPFDV